MVRLNYNNYSAKKVKLIKNINNPKESNLAIHDSYTFINRNTHSLQRQTEDIVVKTVFKRVSEPSPAELRTAFLDLKT